VNPESNLILIPTTSASSYLSSIYTRSPIPYCYRPQHADSATCGKWYQKDFDLIYSAIEKAVELPKEEGSINSIGMTTHLHNFGDESRTTNCGKGFIYPNYAELDMFERWLNTKILPLKNSGKLEFSTANNLIELVKAQGN
jgi:hypothetical protein